MIVVTSSLPDLWMKPFFLLCFIILHAKQNRPIPSHKSLVFLLSSQSNLRNFMGAEHWALFNYYYYNKH